MTRYYRGCDGPNLLNAFPHATEMPASVYGNSAGHVVLHDAEIFDRCGFATIDEACLLYQLGCAMPGNWVELGSWVGWTTTYLASAPNVGVVAVDPEFAHAGFNTTGDAALFCRRFDGNLERAGVLDKVVRVGQRSEEYLPSLPPSVKFAGAFVDAEHEPPFPMEDARMLLPRMKETCCVAFHDTLSPHVQAGVRLLVDAGFKWRLYRTAQLVAVTWRGDFTPPAHTPDPSFGWDQWIGSIGFDRDLLRRQS